MPGYLNQTQQTYYSGSAYGDYQYLSLDEVIDNFTATYVGEGKILGAVLKADVSFHAHRALAELSYDTLKSCKSQEIEVCPNLKMPLPQDYVNYVKLTSVDSNGIEHVLYPTNKTSNPFSIEQDSDNCDDCGDSSSSYEYAKTELKPQELECTSNVTCSFLTTDLDETTHTGATDIKQYMIANPNSFDTNAKRQEYWEKWFGHVDQYCLCLQNSNSEDHCGTQLDWSGWDFTTVSPGIWQLIRNNSGWSRLRNSNNSITDAIANAGTWNSYTNEVESTTPTSNAWDNYKSSGGNSVAIDQSTTTNLAVDADNYFQNTGQRYGLDGQYAQTNGSWYIDCAKGLIHFSSNLSGKTIILKYISDGLGTDGEMLVPKLAEEAIYKWIAYGCLSARADVPEYIVARFKKERYAETRKAKLRLSNIKIEEITQVIRGKNKWIKH
jgi:hypothetical protein